MLSQFCLICLNARILALSHTITMNQIHALRRFGLFDRNVPRYTSYPPATQFREFSEPHAAGRWLSELPSEKPISLYVHIPFCRRLCWFCACRTQGLGNDGRLETYLDALNHEMHRVSELLPSSIEVSRLHFGGGTPTVLSVEQIRRLTDALRSHFPLHALDELSVEIDPNEIDAPRLNAFVEAGMTRASIGVQDFDPLIQETIGRPQTFALTEQTVSTLRDRGIQSLNTDVVYGLPHQTPERLRRSIEQLLSLDPDRVALYGYAHVPWMAKRQVMIPEAALPKAEARFFLSELARELFLDAGYVPIGIDHFAKPSDALAAAQATGHLRRNFQGYSDDLASTLLGLGASAISKLPKGYVQNDATIGGYQSRIQSGQLASLRGHEFLQDDALRARIVEMLLCDFRIDWSQLEREGFVLTDWVRQDADLAASQFAGLITVTDGLFQLEPEARPLARIIAQWFDAYEVASTAHSSAI